MSIAFRLDVKTSACFTRWRPTLLVVLVIDLNSMLNSFDTCFRNLDCEIAQRYETTARCIEALLERPFNGQPTRGSLKGSALNE